MTTGANHESTTQRCRCPQRARDSGSRRHRPHVPQRLSAASCSTNEASPASFASIAASPFASSALMDADQQRLLAPRSSASPSRHRSRWCTFAKGQRKDDVAAEYRAPLRKGPKASCSSARPRRRSPSSAPRSARTPTRARSIPGSSSSHGHGQPVLLLLRRRGLRPLLPQVLHLLPVQRQAVHQRPRVRQAATGQGRHRLRGAGQRHPLLRRPQAPASNLRRPVGRQDRRAAAQVAGASCRIRSPPRTARPAIATTCRSCRPSSP